MTTKKDKKTENFETSLARLEKIVEDLESETTELEGSLKLFEEGVTLAKDLSAKLEDVQQRIETVTKDAKGKLKLKNFDEDED